MGYRYICTEIALAIVLLTTSCFSHPTDPRQSASQVESHPAVQSKSSTISKTANSIKPPRTLKQNFPIGSAADLAARASESKALTLPLPDSLRVSNNSKSHESHALGARSDPPDPTVLEQDGRRLDLSSYGLLKAPRVDAAGFAEALVAGILLMMLNAHSKETDLFPLRNYQFCDRGPGSTPYCFTSYDVDHKMTYGDMTLFVELFHKWIGQWVVEDVPGCHMLFSSIIEPQLVRLAMARFNPVTAANASDHLQKSPSS